MEIVDQTQEEIETKRNRPELVRKLFAKQLGRKKPL